MPEINEVLQKAIEAEQDAYDQYMKAREMVDSQAAMDLLDTLAQEELQHKRMLEEYKMRIIDRSPDTHHVDLQGLELTPTNELNELKEILQCAIAREDAERACYLALQESMDDPTLKELFASLANEEAEHKKRVKEAFANLFE